jgi:hypothetical protein
MIVSYKYFENLGNQEMENRDVISHYRQIDNRHTQAGRYGAIEKCFGTERAYSFTKRIARDLSKELTLLKEQQERGEKQMARIVKHNDRMTAILGYIPGVGLKTIAAFISLES